MDERSIHDYRIDQLLERAAAHEKDGNREEADTTFRLAEAMGSKQDMFDNKVVYLTVLKSGIAHLAANDIVFSKDDITEIPARPGLRRSFKVKTIEKIKNDAVKILKSVNEWHQTSVF